MRILTFPCLILLALNHALGDEPARPSTAVSPTSEFSTNAAVEFVKTHCLDCHAAGDPEAGLNLEDFSSASDVAAAIESWNKIADRVYSGQMPPPESDVPPLELRKSFVDWIHQTIHTAVCDDGVTPGAPMVRRLNRTEYANTVRDLLGIHINAGHALPADGAGGEGFDNAAETLFISPIHAEKYLDAARSALGHAMRDPRARGRIMIAKPGQDVTPRQAARAVLANFLPKAFRRPVANAEIDQYLELFDVASDQDASYAGAVQFALEAAMVSPKFLFLWEEPNETTSPVLISQHEMASRMSYFMWGSMPDAELMRLADAGKLHDETVLAEQVARMLRSEIKGGLRRGAKVREFATSFTEQWLGTRALGREFKPDKSIAGRYDSELEGGMKYEPIFFFEDLLADNRSLLNLIDSDFTYVNNRLARHYRIRGEFREQPKRVDLPPDSRRGGLLGMSAILAVSSFPHRTSPVLRGKWILETLLGTPPPPPPPNVAELDETAGADKPASLRERLELHRADAACASCHATMDPLGFGLENFGVLGQWRSEVDGVPIDARGELPDGTQFEGPAALKKLLLERQDQFIRNMTAKMLGYALARGLTTEDRCVVDSITEILKNNEYKAQTLVLEIVKSVPFRYKHAQGTPSAAGADPGRSVGANQGRQQTEDADGK
jgi:hypothetical protein